MQERFGCKVVVYLILNRETNSGIEFLLQKRCNTGYMDGKYDMATSGHLEAGESLSMAVIREAKEEIDIEIDEKNLKLVAVINPYQEGYLNIFFTTEKYKGIPKIMEKDKCSDLRWFNINNLPENIIERYRVVIKNMNNGVIYDDGDFSITGIDKMVQ